MAPEVILDDPAGISSMEKPPPVKSMITQRAELPA